MSDTEDSAKSDVASRGTSTLRFSRDDVVLFAEASHDRNPLHLSSDYARKSSFGEPIVFGVLSTLVCIGHLRDRSEQSLSSITVEFRAPLFIETDYIVDVTDPTHEESKVLVHDGAQVALEMTVRFRGGEAATITENKSADVPNQLELDVPTDDEMFVGRAQEGRYSPNWKLVETFYVRFGLLKKGISVCQVVVLMSSSYVIGMKIPGRRAMFWRLSLQFASSRDAVSQPLTYETMLQSFDRRFDLLRMNVRLSFGESELASGELWSFVRQELSIARSGGVEASLRRTDVFKGKVALVIGASRGFGAALCLALALQGCTVLVNFLRSSFEAEELRVSISDPPGEMLLMQGDGGDLSWCEQAYLQIVKDHGRLDFLICNAIPALLPLRLHARTASRISSYVTKSFSLVSTPMAVFMPLLRNGSGWSVTVSTAWVKSPPPEWAHYISAKLAVEGLTSVAALENAPVSFLVVRPPTLATDLSSTPFRRRGALAPEEAAIHVAMRLGGPTCPGRVEVLEDFSGSEE